MYSTQITSLVLSLLLGQALGQSVLKCNDIIAGDHKFDLSKLGGPHSVVTSRLDQVTGNHFNTTYTLDICDTLKKSGKAKKTEECPNGTRVCAIQRLLSGESDTVSEVIPIAGALENHGGTMFEYKAERLKTSDSNSDSQKEGLRLTLQGGKHMGRKQKAIVEFLCSDKEGTENEWDSEDKYEKNSKMRREEKDGEKDPENGSDEDEVEHQLLKDGAALIWESYSQVKDEDILRLTWNTTYACEKRDGGKDNGNDGDGGASSHWGFFTWFVIITFLGIAAYLIFGSWLNYNRYGARGWDLLPHGDTIRDVPYLLKDWVRRVLNTVQGAGSRGGYSAV
ncbi:autophagy-related protein 27 [Stachybotrys elegans]|uniref:Autophagy-related protein 27 n=1 Tax=Stachybotrys elegans TaxID=80388 RepID=A0A8K0WTS0_9HYPO|nr:autophagy-related protein 27 [Stachybotrys elegans]